MPKKIVVELMEREVRAVGVALDNEWHRTKVDIEVFSYDKPRQEDYVNHQRDVEDAISKVEELKKRIK